MLRGFWTIAGAGLVLAVTALSMRMNFEFVYSLGTSEGTGRIFGLLSVAFDGLKALLPLFVAWQWRDGRKLRAAAGAGLFVLVAAYGLASALGFASQHREGVTASQDNLNASLKEDVADLETAETRLKALGARRVSGVVEADIARLKKDRLWDGTSGCTNATLNASREFCKRIEFLRAELALAAEDTVLSAKIEGLKFRIGQLRAKGAGREADPQLGEIARAAGLDILRVRSGMNWLLAIAVEAVSCFGLFAIAWQREGRGTNRAKAEPQGARPWRLVEGAEVPPSRPLLRLTARLEDAPVPGKAKGSKAKGKTGRKAQARPRGNPRNAETDQSTSAQQNAEKGAIDVR